MRFFIYYLIISICLSTSSFATETCSRVATINFQEVLIDSNASEKGEGLRYHLEKDPVAVSYLNTYQKNSSVRWPNAILGTLGTSMLLYGFFNSNSQDRQIYLITGSATILVNFLIARTLEVSNEVNLNRAIEEYNKRNLPKIFFNPEGNLQGNIPIAGLQFGLNKVWSF